MVGHHTGVGNQLEECYLPHLKGAVSPTFSATWKSNEGFGIKKKSEIVRYSQGRLCDKKGLLHVCDKLSKLCDFFSTILSFFTRILREETTFVLLYRQFIHKGAKKALMSELR